MIVNTSDIAIVYINSLEGLDPNKMITTATVFVTLAIFLGLTAPLAAFAELDVQVYEGEGAVGIIVAERDAGFDVALDQNSKVTVTGTNISLVGGGDSSNDTGSEITAPAVIEIPHINSVDGHDYNYTAANITSSTDVINEITGGTISEESQNVTTNDNERECIGGVLTEGYSEPTDFEICYLA